jgi:hypothetical protein
MRTTTSLAAAALVIGTVALAGETPAAAQGGGGEPPSASQELQGAYPLRESMRCCRTYSRALPTPPDPVRPPSHEEEGSWTPPLVALIAVFALGGLAVTLLARAGLPTVREVRTRLASRDNGPPEPYVGPPPRHERPVSHVVIRLARPLFRYSYGLDGYVLRLIGGRRGPVLRERRPPPDQLW